MAREAKTRKARRAAGEPDRRRIAAELTLLTCEAFSAGGLHYALGRAAEALAERPADAVSLVGAAMYADGAAQRILHHARSIAGRLRQGKGSKALKADLSTFLAIVTKAARRSGEVRQLVRGDLAHGHAPLGEMSVAALACHAGCNAASEAADALSLAV